MNNYTYINYELIKRLELSLTFPLLNYFNNLIQSVNKKQEILKSEIEKIPTYNDKQLSELSSFISSKYKSSDNLTDLIKSIIIINYIIYYNNNTKEIKNKIINLNSNFKLNVFLHKIIIIVSRYMFKYINTIFSKYCINIDYTQNFLNDLTKNIKDSINLTIYEYIDVKNFLDELSSYQLNENILNQDAKIVGGSHLRDDNKENIISMNTINIKKNKSSSSDSISKSSSSDKENKPTHSEYIKSTKKQSLTSKDNTKKKIIEQYGAK